MATGRSLGISPPQSDSNKTAKRSGEWANRRSFYSSIYIIMSQTDTSDIPHLFTRPVPFTKASLEFRPLTLLDVVKLLFLTLEIILWSSSLDALCVLSGLLVLLIWSVHQINEL